MRKREKEIPEPQTQTETPIDLPPIQAVDAVSLSTVLSLQQQTTEEELEKETHKDETPYHPPASNQIPALTLERDARKITIPSLEPAPAPTPSTPVSQPPKPLISPWTRQRLDQVALSPVDLASKMGWTINEHPKTAWETQQKPSSSYSASPS